MKHDHKLTYIQLHPQALKPARAEWPYALACVVLFAAIGAMLAY